jgi:alkylation response protein AidB-like acyl-CoA dehydrogenase
VEEVAMDLKFTPEEEAFRQEVASWFAQHLQEKLERPRLGGLGEESAEEFARARAWHRQLYAGGWVGMNWPKQYGGRDATLIQQVIFQQEAMRVGAPPGVNLIGIGMIGPTIMQWGTEAQKERYLRPMLAGEEIWAQGFSEPGAGSDVAALQCAAVRDGDDYIVNGQKVWTTGAQWAQWIELLVRTDPSKPKHEGISCLIVDMHSPGITVRPLKQITGDASFNEIFFENVRVPRANLLGPENAGWKVAITTLMHERVAIGGLGMGESALEQLVDLTRRVRRHGKSAVEDSAVRQQLAQFAIEIKAARYSALRRLTKQLRGTPPGPEGSAGKLTLTELQLKMSRFAFELLGPYATLLETSPYRVGSGRWATRVMEARGMSIAGGTTEIQKNILAVRALHLPRQ